MQLIADLHIHSHYSRATSKDLTLDNLALWAQRKGVNIVGTGDISHPGWLEEMRANLEEAEQGLYRLKPEVAAHVEQNTPAACRSTVRFLLAGEISNIYKRHGATRKVHNIIFAPSLAVVERIQTALERIGNIRSDGRPILGLDSRDLLEIILEIDERCHLIPAHIWTPWFSMLGSKSGFDSVEECFGDLTSHIFALETGLSSDPPMNWRVANLDRYTLVSNSDAHSPPKLGREATLFNIDLTYDALFAALRSGDPNQFAGTLEFFPEEGKYHLDGHRACGICWEPPATIAHHGICPVCGKEITVGVMHRVEVLADRPLGGHSAVTHPYANLVPLPEVLCEVHGCGPSARKVKTEYDKLLERLGPELYILRQAPLEEIAIQGGPRLAEAIRRMRSSDVVAQGGYDGEYGVIRLLDGYGDDAAHGAPQIRLLEAEQAEGSKGAAVALAEQPASWMQSSSADAKTAWAQDDLFAEPPLPPRTRRADCTTGAASEGRAQPGPAHTTAEGEDGRSERWLERLNPEQREAALYSGGPLAIIAGPGTGKTRTLTVRIAHLLQTGQAAPQSILAITFTNKAADEMAERLAALAGKETAAAVTVKTFHAFGAHLLCTYGAQIGLPENFVILDETDRSALLKRAFPKLSERATGLCLERISTCKNQLQGPEEPSIAGEVLEEIEGRPYLATLYAGYEAALRAAQAVDFDDLILLSVHLLQTQPQVLAAVHDTYRWISVDEYQDVNLAQVRLLRLLTAGGANLCVIGDPDQAIYGFRGADPRFFLSFSDDYPQAKQLRLSRSYRSPQSLLDAAGQVLAANINGEALRLWSEYSEQVKIDVHPAATDKAEAEYIVHQVEQMVGGTSYFSIDSGRVDERGATAERGFRDFAVLYRLNAQAGLLIEAFDRSGIPYQVVGQASPYASKPVRELLACLWLLHNSASRLHLDLLLSAGRSAPSDEYLNQVAQVAAEHGFQLAVAFEDAAARHTFKAAQRPRLAVLARGWSALAGDVQDQPVTVLLGRAQQLLAGLHGENEDAPQSPGLKLLLQRAIPYGARLGEFLAATALARAADAYDPRADRVTLSTLHAAKGLEFPVVFIAGCEEGLLPYLPPHGRADVEEERRLFYVGMTRPQQRLLLSHARSRFLFGESRRPAPSPFLDDIEQVLKQVQAGEFKERKPKPQDPQLSLF